MESLLDESVKEGLFNLFGKKVEYLTRQQLMTLALAYSEEEITNERLQYALGMHRADITQMLSKMCSQQLLESSGRGRGTKYHVHGLNVGQPYTNVELNMGLPNAKKGLNMGLNMGPTDANMGLQKKRYSKEEVKSLIVNYCSDWRTAEEIAAAVERKVRYVRAQA